MHNYSSRLKTFKFYLKNVWEGKSLIRTLHNIHLRKISPFRGNGIDYGAKNGSSSYYKFIDLKDGKWHLQIFTQIIKR